MDEKEYEKLINTNKKLKNELNEKNKAFDAIVKETFNRANEVYNYCKDGIDNMALKLSSNFDELNKINKLNVDNYIKTHEEFVKEYSTIQNNRIEKLNNELNGINKELELKNELIENNLKNKIKLEKYISDLESRIVEYVNMDLKLQENDKLISEINELLNSKNSIISSNNLELKSLMEKCLEHEQNIKSMNMIMEVLTKDNENYKRLIAEEKNKSNQTFANNQEMVLTIEKKEYEIICLKNQITEYKNKLIVLENTINENKILIDDIYKRNEELTSQIINESTRYSQLSIEKSNLENDLVIIKKELDTKRNKLEKLELNFHDELKSIHNISNNELNKNKKEFENKIKDIEKETEEKILKSEKYYLASIEDYEKKIIAFKNRIDSSIEVESINRTEIRKYIDNEIKYKREIMDFEKSLAQIDESHKRELNNLRKNNDTRISIIIEEKDELEKKYKNIFNEKNDKIVELTKVLAMSKDTVTSLTNDREELIKKFNNKSADYNDLLNKFGSIMNNQKELSNERDRLRNELDELNKKFYTQSNQLSELIEKKSFMGRSNKNNSISK